MNTKTFQLLAQLLLIAGMFVAITIFWDQIPFRVPSHWGADGKPNDYMPKSYGIFLLPGLCLLILGFMAVLPVIDPKLRKSKVVDVPQSKPYLLYSLVLVVCLTGLFVIQMMTAMDKLGQDFPYVNFLVALMILALGNFLAKLRPNYFVGIRTPWTLESEEVWIKTHRVTGYIWVGLSVAIIAIMFATSPAFYGVAFIVFIATIVIVPLVYSYIAYRQLKGIAK